MIRMYCIKWWALQIKTGMLFIRLSNCLIKTVI